MSFYRRNNAPPIEYEQGEMLTEQSHVGTTDVNFIIDQFTRTGVLKHSEQYAGTYGEFLSGDIYELAQTGIAEANSMFETLPPEVRGEFTSGAGEFLEFIQDPNNIDQIKELGLDTSHLEPFAQQTATQIPKTRENVTEDVTEALTDTQGTE